MQTIHEERVDLRTWVGVLGTMLGAFMATLGILAGAVLVWLCHQAKAVPGAVAH